MSNTVRNTKSKSTDITLASGSRSIAVTKTIASVKSVFCHKSMACLNLVLKDKSTGKLKPWLTHHKAILNVFRGGFSGGKKGQEDN